MPIPTMSDLDLKGKRILIREDFNVPLKNGQVTSDLRIRAAIPTIKKALKAGGQVMLMSHLGRPNDGVYDEIFSLAPVARTLSNLLKQEVPLIKNWTDGVNLNDTPLVLLENVRFNHGETNNNVELSKKMAALCDIFVMDAFATSHRIESSTCGVIKYAKQACAGPLLLSELNALNKIIEKPTHPIVAIVGGSKVSTKLALLDSLVKKVDYLIIGGGIANTFLAAEGYTVGKSLYEPDLIDEAERLTLEAKKREAEVPLPIDVVVSEKLAENTEAYVRLISQIDDNEKIFDMGPDTIKQFVNIIKKAKTILWNGPIGAFEIEEFAQGTQAIAEAVANSKAFKVAGGGDTLAAIEKYQVSDKIDYISTGGGAFLTVLEGKTLPVIAALEERFIKKRKKYMNHLRRTKIVITLGPALDDAAMLERVILAGAVIFRANFSHGDISLHEARINKVREIAAKHEKTVAILIDLQGPKIRIGRFKHDKIKLIEGQSFILDTALDEDAGDEKAVALSYESLPRDVYAGDTLLLDDGRLVLKVIHIHHTQIHCQVIVGGDLSNNKGLNRLGGGLSAAALTDKDRADIKEAVRLQADYIAVSFPRHADDIKEARILLKAAGGHPGIIAKIERSEAITNLAGIIYASDAVMIARGDLGVEIGDAELPAMQKKIIKMAKVANKPVITATQMLESMIQNTIPTRAEVSDVANAVLDGTDAVMLSGETAVGLYPDKAVAAMDRICLSAEKHSRSQLLKHAKTEHFNHVDEAIASATMYTANHLDIKAIITLTESGTTPLLMSRVNSSIPIYGLSRHATTLRRLTLYRGVYPIPFNATDFDRRVLNQSAILELHKRQILQNGDLVIITKGDLIGVHGRTNSMKIVSVDLTRPVILPV